MRTVFLRVGHERGTEAGLREAIRAPQAGGRQGRFDVDPQSFSSVPRSPFAYWVSDATRKLFTDLPPFEGDGRAAKQGLATSDDWRFLRLWWEPRARPLRRWFCFAKGGRYSPHYLPIPLVLDWLDEGRELKAFAETTPGTTHWSRRVPNSEFYFQPGLTWPVRAVGLSPSPVPRNSIFSARGYLALAPEARLLSLMALMSSRPFEGLFRLELAGVRPEFVVGVLTHVPVPFGLDDEGGPLGQLARSAWSLKRGLDTCTENTHAFSLPALLQYPSGTLATRAAAWADRVDSTGSELAAIQAEIDDRCFGLYGIDDEDRKAITEGFGESIVAPPIDDAAGEAASDSSSASEASAPTRAAADDFEPDDSDESSIADATTLSADLLSWSIGVAFGRFDLRLATGERALPPEPDPFDPLPACSPGMLTGADGLPCATPPPGYPIDFSQDGVLLDDPGHPRDLTGSARAVFDVVFGADADARWQEAAGILDPRSHDLRAFVARTFFEQHLKRYSKSRRKAPIYWQLATPAASYSVWLYAHRLTPDTFFHVLHDVVGPKVGHEERRLLSLTQESGPNPTASQRKEIAGQETFVDELRAFRDEVARVAPLWRPDLDDGVTLTMAPLWRLVPQHRAWQKELKSAWDSLSAGEYDWAHVAMHLWPERVVPKCAADRSLAIAHGLEEVFWEEDAKGKWAARKKPLTPVATLVAERTSPAVKAALKDLLEAPQNSGASKGRRKGRADA